MGTQGNFGGVRWLRWVSDNPTFAWGMESRVVSFPQNLPRQLQAVAHQVHERAIDIIGGFNEGPYVRHAFLYTWRVGTMSDFRPRKSIVSGHTIPGLTHSHQRHKTQAELPS